MKEAFWGVLIVLLGLFGIVVVNIFQNVTVDNDRVYYLIKESTEASAFDAIDLTYYRLSGKLRIVEDKFVENLTRRFAENVTIGDYRIVVEDINEMPPKISLRVRSGVTSLRGDNFGIVNRVDGILETKYSLDEVLSFLEITKEEWEKIIVEVSGTEENICKVTQTDDDDDMECISGDIKFDGFEATDLVSAVCQTEKPGPKIRNAKYKVCDCGKWVENKDEVRADPEKVGNEWVYTWKFEKIGTVRTIRESIKSRVNIQICTTSIGEMVPNDIEKTKPKEDGSTYEPSKDNSKYIACPAEGIKIPVGMKFMMHPNYIPKESVNRNLVWSTSDKTIIGVQGSNPASTCILNEEGTNCFSKAIITAKKVGIAYVNVKTTRNQTATCKIEVFDGNVDSLSCEDLTLEYNSSGVMKRNFKPLNALYTDFKWSISDTDIATINENSGAVTAKKSGTATVTITAPNGKNATCKLTVKSKPSSGGGGGGGSVPSGGSCSCPYTVYTKGSCTTTETTYYVCGKEREPYSCNCRQESCKGCPSSVKINVCDTCYRLAPKYCEKKGDTVCEEVEGIKYVSGSRVIDSSPYYVDGNYCTSWVSWCSTSRGNCDHQRGLSC